MMKDDKTVIMKLGEKSIVTGNDVLDDGLILRVNVKDTKSTRQKTYIFNDTFHVGRSKVNDVVISDKAISRKHLEFKKEQGNWYIHDLDSANGTFMGEKPITTKGEILKFPCSLKFGSTNTVINIDLDIEPMFSRDSLSDDSTRIIQQNLVKFDISPAKSSLIKDNTDYNNTKKTSLSPEDIKRKFISKSGNVNAGEYTQLVRAVIVENRQEKTKKYRFGLWIVTILLVTSLGLIAYQQILISNAKTLALDMFYDMKEMEVSLGKVEYQLANELQRIQQAELKNLLQHAANTKRQKLQDMQAKYLDYLEKIEKTKLKNINPFSKPKSYEQQLILEVASKFGESELELPEAFSNEVSKYIRYWKSTSRMQRSMQRLENQKYKPIIVNALKKQNLPPHFLYLVLQESNFVNTAVGPKTRHGIAKGAWQFLPGTGAEFGLVPGPLSNTTNYDSKDERFNFEKASTAGAKYLKHIYNTEAQASGLLVLAGYNYGHNRVKSMIKKMPKNPRQRNFWAFTQKYEIPQETYDYVFYIFAAAVIGEDPKYFGFKFSPPFIQ